MHPYINDTSRNTTKFNKTNNVKLKNNFSAYINNIRKSRKNKIIKFRTKKSSTD